MENTTRKRRWKRCERTCLFCNKRVLKRNLRAHLRSHIRELPYFCSVCSKELSTSSAFMYHEKLHFPINEKDLHACSKCNKKFKNKSALKSHMMVHSEDRPVKCPKCDGRFKSKMHLRNHLPIHSNERPYSCKFCDKCYKFSKHLSRHIQIIHKNEKRHYCRLCTKRFSSPSELENHIRTHTGENPFHCQFCTSKFTAKGDLKFHQKHHCPKSESRAKETCKICGVMLASKKYLYQHMKIHREEKVHKCLFCGKSFVSLERLRMHILKHTGERPHKCKFCPNAFPTKGTKAIHEEVAHSSITTVKMCDICEKFVSKYSYSLHRRRCTGLIFSCTFYGLTFKSHGGLSTHLRIHINERLAFCTKCGQEFLHVHERKSHVLKKCIPSQWASIARIVTTSHAKVVIRHHHESCKTSQLVLALMSATLDRLMT